MAKQKRANQSEDDSDRSPVCKRARYELDGSDIVPWTLSKNELILHSVYDQGVGSLNANDAELKIERRKVLETKRTIISPNAKREQIAMLEASLPENTLQKLTSGELVKLGDNQGSDSISSKKESTTNYFDFLSDEVILHIFQKLTKPQLINTALVCQRFSQLIEDESLWVRVDVSDRTLPEGVMGKILSRQVIILKLSRSRILVPSILSNVKAAQPDFRSRLMYLDLTMVKASPECLVSIFVKCKRLKKLSLESVPINDDVLVALSNNRDIEVINLAMCEGIRSKGVKAFFTNCRKIRELNLSWTYLTSSLIDFICQNLPSTLDRFNFSGCRKLLLDRHVSRIISNCPNLRELDLSDCTAITGESIKRITNLSDLNCLAISRCYLIQSKSLLFLRMNKSLAYLDIHGNFASPNEYKIIEEGLSYRVNVDKFMFSSIARPCVGNKNTIWNMRVRD